MKNKSHWRTTVGGLLSAVGKILTICPFPYAPLVGAGIGAIGSALLGIQAADKKAVGLNSAP